MLRVLTLSLLALVALAVIVVAAYYVGRAQCPPPDWWVAAFVPSGNWGCVA